MKTFKNKILVLGGDGYLGWSLSLAFANRLNFEIIIVDNLIKRKWELDLGLESLTNISSPQKRIVAYKAKYGKDNLRYINLDLRDYDKVFNLIREIRPYAIVNAAQQVSAPFSMLSSSYARETIEINQITNLNVLWSIKLIDQNIKYIKLGSSGCFLSIDTDNIPEEKVDLTFGDGHEIRNSWLPMQASDIYHQSKISSFLLSDLASDVWGLNVTTVQQSTIFGHNIKENIDFSLPALFTRLNYDSIFGTVVNRFICQSIVGHPLTIYGEGNSETGIISLEDTVERFIDLLFTNTVKGKHIVKNNYSHRLSINDIADIVKIIKPNTEVIHIENPRIEKQTSLPKHYETSFCNEKSDSGKMYNEFELLYNFASLHKQEINNELILPTVKWNTKKQCAQAPYQLEDLEIQ